MMNLDNIEYERRIKELELQLQESQSFNKSLIESLPELIFIINSDNVFIDYKASQNALLYAPPELFLGKKIDEVLPPNISNLLLDAINEVQVNNIQKQFDYSLNIQDDLYYFSATVNSFAEDKFIGIVRDITDLTESREVLDNAYKRNKIFIEQMPNSVAMMDKDMKYLAASNRWISDYGLFEKEIIGISHYEIFPEIGDEWKAIHQRGLKGEIIKNDEDLFVRTNGDKQWLRWEVKPWYNDENEIGGVLLLSEDITAFKKVEYELRESQNNLELFFNQSMIGFFIMLLDEPLEWNDDINKEQALDITFRSQRIHRINQAMLNQYGAKESDFIGLTPNQLFEHDMNHGRNIWRELFDTGKLHTITYEKKFDGSDLIIEGDYTCLYDENGRIIGHFGVQQDVTERVNTQKLLEKSDNLLKKLSQQVPGVVYLFKMQPDGHTSFPFASENIYDIYEVNPEDVVSDASLVFSRLHPEDLERVSNSIFYSRDNLSNWEIDYRVILPQKGIRWLHGVSKPELQADGCVVWYGYIYDITDKKEAEIELQKSREQFALAVDGTNDGIWDWDIKNNVTFFSKRWKELIGFDEDEIEHSFEAFRELMHPDDYPLVEKALKDYFGRKRDVYEVEFRFRHKEGHYIWILARGKAIFNEDGKPIRMAGSHSDITLRKLAEFESKEQKEKAEKANESKSQFLANMSHEIRTPLNGVIGFTELLKTTKLDKIQTQYVDNSLISAHSLLTIINDILDFSKIEAGKLDLEIIKIDIFNIVGQISDIFAFQATKKGIELLLNIAPDVPRYIFADPIRLKQVLSNLTNNAVKFTENGEIEIIVKFQKIDSSEGELYFEIRDTGIGIDAKARERLFKSFEQADKSTTRKYGGTGLGLVISAMLIEKMGGKIDFQSHLGVGSRFFFDFNTIYEYGVEDISRVLDDIERILVIDDNEKNRLILEDSIKAWGAEYTGVSNGIDAIKILKNDFFDVIIVDYNMPEIDGIETIRLIRNQLKLSAEKQPVILLSSSSDDLLLGEKIKELGVRFNLTKPVKQDILFMYLKNIHQPKISMILNAENEYKDNKLNQNEQIEDNKPTILVVEDVIMNLKLILIRLRKMLPDAVILEARNGQFALNLLKVNDVDLILMDIQMPELDGISATKIIRSMDDTSKRNVPIIALTAGALVEEKEKCLAAGMNDFLTKPLDADKLSKVLSKFLPKKQTSKNVELINTLQLDDVQSFNKNELMERLENDQEIFEQILMMGNEQIQSLIDNIAQFIGEKHAENIKKAAHTLKGVALNLAFDRIAIISKEIELNSEQSTDFLEQYLSVLNDEWQKVKRII